VGAEQMGACLYELADGQRSHPYHFHHGVEEWLIVLQGAPVVRTPEGERALRRGDVLCFPVGAEGGHQVSGPGTLLIISENRDLDLVEYPENGTVELRPSGRIFRSAEAVDIPGRRVTEPLNLYDVAVEEGEPAPPPGYRCRWAGFRQSIGAERLGGSVYELDPGESTCPYHYEGVEEEWLLVLTGTPSLRDPEGEHELAPGDLVCFTPGPDGGHKLTNRSDASSRVVMLSTMPPNEVSICVYPDSDKVGVWPWPAKRLRLAGAVDYWYGEV
jgi:uncharacterized cupin superfamily protein